MRGKLICVCKEAKTNYYLLCPKGRKVNPDKVFSYEPWPRGTKI